MVVFIVPIKSKQVSSNWDVFSILVERTMRSLCRQTSQNFKLVAVCHEIPNFKFTHPNLEFLQVNFPPPPKNPPKDEPTEYRNALKEADKAQKIMAGYEYAKKYNPSFIMVSDADDCVKNTLVEFAEQNPEEPVGWYFKSGYIYNEGSNLLFLNKNTFNILCGTCILIKAQYFDRLLQKEPRALYMHDMMDLGDGIHLKPLPFHGAIYSIGNTENYCSTPEAVKRMNSYKVFEWSFYENIFRKMSKYRVSLLTEKKRNAFGLTKLDFSSVF